MHDTHRISIALAVALAAATFVATPSKAAWSDECAAYANDVARDYNRGLVGNVLTLPLDVTGAVLAGKTTHDGERQRIFDEAFADCMSANGLSSSSEIMISHLLVETPKPHQKTVGFSFSLSRGNAPLNHLAEA